MASQTIEYEVIAKATVERGGGQIQYALKVLYRGDGTPWWTCSASLDLPVSEDVFKAARIASKLTIAIDA